MQQIYCTAILTSVMVFGFSTICSASEIYKLVDDHGRVIFTNQPIKGSQQVQLGKIRLHQPKTTVSTYQKNIVPGNYPKVSKLQQNKRDSRRQQILSQELINETKLLDDTMKTINSTIKKTKQHSSEYPYFVATQFDILQLRDQAASHERNIKALKTELNNL
jgi:hypothetical protein